MTPTGMTLTGMTLTGMTLTGMTLTELTLTGLTEPTVLTGALLGASGGLGAWLVLVRLPWLRRPTLDDRLAPYVREAVAPSRLLVREARSGSPLAVLERLLAPVMADATRWVERVSGGPGTVRRRLDQLGERTTVEEFRAEQVLWGLGGLGAGLVAAVLVAAAPGLLAGAPGGAGRRLRGHRRARA